MKILGYAPNSDYPFIPDFILTPTGMYNIQGRPADGESVKIVEIDILDDEWIGISSTGQVEIFKREHEGTWKIKAAINAIQEIKDPKANPIKSIQILRAATDLIGVDLPTMLKEIETNKLPGESMVSTWTRMHAKKT